MTLEEFIAALKELAQDKQWLEQQSEKELEALWDALKEALEATIAAWHKAPRE